jgi:hypothetical protein
MSRSEQIAAWVTALATAVQTIVVTGALVIAVKEWKRHEDQIAASQLDAVVKIYTEASQSAARVFLHNYTSCRSLYLSDELKQKYADLAALCARFVAYDESTVFSKSASIEQTLNNVQLCNFAGVCNSYLSQRLFCGDAFLIELRDAYFQTRTYYGHEYANFAQECPYNSPEGPNSFWSYPNVKPTPPKIRENEPPFTLRE